MTSLDDSARSVFFAWERWRIPFNGIMIAAMWIEGLRYVKPEFYWQTFLLNLLILNVCFCIGPVIEGYVSMLNFKRQNARLVILLFGTIFAWIGQFFLTFFTSRAIEGFHRISND